MNSRISKVVHPLLAGNPDGEHEAERKYEAILEAMDVGFCVVEVLFDEEGQPLDYRFVEANARFSEQTGLKNAPGKRVQELAPALEGEWYQACVRVALTGATERFQSQIAAPGRWFEVSIFPCGPAEQRRVGILLRDITTQRETDEALRRSVESLRRAFEIETVGVIFFKTDGSIPEANAAFLRMSGYTREDLQQGRLSWRQMTPSEWMPISMQAISEFKRRGHTTPYEKEYIRKDGSHWWGLFAATRVSEDEGVEFIIDITDKKQAEQALKEARETLQQINQELETLVQERTARLQNVVSELHQVSYAMVHDMRAPLRAMHGFAEIVQAMHNEGTPAEARDFCRRIVLAAERLDNLITDALAYTKVVGQELAVQAVDLHNLLTELIETYPNFHEDIAEIVIEGRLPNVIGNKALLTQCFSNLLGNAVKFVAPSVKPRIRVRHELLCDHERRQPFVRVWVEDNGIGIPKEAQGRLFKIFQRFHVEYPGTGIGLAIVSKVVERMGGSVGVESEPGRGSRFWVDLPSGEENYSSPPSGMGAFPTQLAIPPQR